MPEDQADNKRTKRYFISDIHLTDDNSHKKTAKSYPYSWIGKTRIKMLADFVNGLAADPTTKDVVILGDLFDRWVCPANVAPAEFGSIMGAQANKAVMAAFRNVASSGAKLFYVYGNHDMTLDKAELIDAIQGIQVLGDGKNLGLYHCGLLAAEHGHKYCLFNAPDTKLVSSYLPSGQTITRIVTQNVANTGKGDNQFGDMIAVIKEALEHMGDPLVETVLVGLAHKYGWDENMVIQMSDSPVKLGQMVELYKDDYDRWSQAGSGVNAFTAVLDDMGTYGGNLHKAAEDIYFAKDHAKIVIFGHTHAYELHTDPWDATAIDENGIPDLAECNSIYANCGSWVDGCKKATWVETEKDRDGDKHHVRLRWYHEDGTKSTIRTNHIALS
ncbi:MAG: metallophosphoesterase [Nitrospinota bacterium]|nr:metallophosphoesterase [Nitrospinota bacterium]